MNEVGRETDVKGSKLWTEGNNTGKRVGVTLIGVIHSKH